MSQFRTFEDLFEMLRRRGPMIVALTGLGAVAALLCALSLPRGYEAIAMIQVDSPAVTAEGAASGMGPARRLQLIEQRLTARDNLVNMIERHGLFTGLEALALNEKVALLRRSVRIEPVTAARPGLGDARLTALAIFVQMGEPGLAAAVANDFAAGILAHNRAAQDARLRESLAFYEAEGERLSAAIAGLEAEISAYRTANSDALPAGLTARHEERLQLDEELRGIDRRMLEAGHERAALAEQRAPLAARRDLLAEAIGRTPSVAMTLGSYDRRLRQLQQEYDAIARRRAEAGAGQRLEDGWRGERFSMLETALPPERPMASGRPKVLVLGVAGSGILALALAFLLDLLNPVIRNAAQFERQLGMRPVAVIPHIETPADGRRRRTAMATAMVLTLGAFMAALSAAGAMWLVG